MEYRAVGNRCAVDLKMLRLPISHTEAKCILIEKGFAVIDVDLIALARSCINTSQYKRGAHPDEAPSVVDCSSFIKWLYSQRGIWLPRRSIQQRDIGEPINLCDVRVNDLVFASGRINYYNDNPRDGVGHVGIVTDKNTVIHASNRKTHVTEATLQKFAEGAKFRGARRFLPANEEVITLEIPSCQEVEISDDIRWIILQSLKV